MRYMTGDSGRSRQDWGGVIRRTLSREKTINETKIEN